MTWNAHVYIKGNGKFKDAQWDEIKKWAEVEQVWSTQGDWDWFIKLRSSVNTPEAVEKIVFNLRSKPWVSTTQTWWAKAI